MAGDPHWASVIAAMHMDGANNSAVFTDVKGKVITPWNSPVISTAQSKFGGASLKLNGSNQYLALPNSTDFDFPGAFTIDGWVYLLAYPSVWAALLSRYYDNTNAGYRIILNSAGGAWQLSFANTAGVAKGVNGAALTLNAWHHIEVGFDGTTYYLFTNGTLNSTLVDTAPKPVGTQMPPYIGTTNASAWFLNGHVDDFRITKGVCRHKASFTPETAPFSEYTSYLSGTVRDVTGALCARTVRGYDRVTGLLSGSTVSNATTGAYTLTTQTINPHTVVVLDDDAGTQYNALVLDKVMPL